MAVDAEMKNCISKATMDAVLLGATTFGEYLDEFCDINVKYHLERYKAELLGITDKLNAPKDIR